MEFEKKKRTEARWCQGGPKRVQHARQMNAIGLTESYGQDRGGCTEDERRKEATAITH